MVLKLRNIDDKLIKIKKHDQEKIMSIASVVYTFDVFRAFMIGLFHVNSAAFPFLELLSGHQKCWGFAP